MLLHCRSHVLSFPHRPLVMGIVNINDDSFCGDGTLDVSAALAQAEQMLHDGADIIDIGAESARTNRGPITIDQEVARLAPFLERWPSVVARLSSQAEPQMGTDNHDAQKLDSDTQVSSPSETIRDHSRPFVVQSPAPCSLPPASSPLLSLNTWRSEVAEQILPLGGDILNDISGLPSPHNAQLAAQHGAALLIMHSVGQPKVPHTHIAYPDIMSELDRFFEEKIALARSAGLAAEQIILDPGIDFAKQCDDNLRIYRELDRLHRFDRPILLPVSRKTVIGDVLHLPHPNDRDAGTVACIAAGLRRGAHIFRVHHVPAAAQSVKVLWALHTSIT